MTAVTRPPATGVTIVWRYASASTLPGARHADVALPPRTVSVRTPARLSRSAESVTVVGASAAIGAGALPFASALGGVGAVNARCHSIVPATPAATSATAAIRFRVVFVADVIASLPAPAST